MRTRVSLGFKACNTSQPRPSFSKAPGRRFSINTSVLSSNCLMMAMPWGDLRLSARDCLLRDCRYHHREVPSCSFRHLRRGSPWPIDSILMTSAPNSAIRRAAKGAAIRVPISSTRIPVRGAVILVTSFVLGMEPRLREHPAMIQPYLGKHRSPNANAQLRARTRAPVRANARTTIG
ncbi:hypothetical protein D3C81_1441630 [compost metagenome]